MQKKFITNLIILLFLNLLIKPFWILGIDRSVQNVVGAHDYGFYFAIFNFTFLFNILLDFGITNFNNRNIAQNHHLLQKHFSSIIVLKLLLAFVYIIISFTVAFIIGYDAAQVKMLVILGVNQFLISFILYLRSNISGLHFFKTDSLISVLDRTLMILICGVLLWGNVTKSPFKIEWFVYSQTAAYLITALVALLIVIKKAKFSKLNWNWPFFVLIIKKSYPFAILVLLMAFYNRIDSVMIERLLPSREGEVQAGFYASAFRLLDATNMIAYLFSVILLPLFARMIKFKQPVEQLARLSFTLLFILAITVAVGSFFYNTEFMTMLYPKNIFNETDAAYAIRIQEISYIFGLLMTGFIPIATTYVFGSLLTANGNLKQLNIVAACGMVLNITLNLILIPRFMAIGSAWASVITQLLTASIQVVIAKVIFRFKTNQKYILSLVIFSLGVILITYLSKQIGFDWKINFVIMVILSIILASATKLLNIRAAIKILKSESE
jgi:O-antigen/teichoic acid export membrane protein